MAQARQALIVAAVATVTGTAFNIAVPAGKENLPVVVRGITTATVLIEGSLDGTNYVTLLSKTADFAGVVTAFPYMRGKVTAWTSGTIYVDLWADKVFGS